jgi:hypothetical protein
LRNGPGCLVCNYEFGGIAKCRIRKPSNPFAQALRKLFRSPAHPSGERQNGKGGGYENDEMPLRSEDFDANRDRDKERSGEDIEQPHIRPRSIMRRIAGG